MTREQQVAAELMGNSPREQAEKRWKVVLEEWALGAWRGDMATNRLAAQKILLGLLRKLPAWSDGTAVMEDLGWKSKQAGGTWSGWFKTAVKPRKDDRSWARQEAKRFQADVEKRDFRKAFDTMLRRVIRVLLGVGSPEEATRLGWALSEAHLWAASLLFHNHAAWLRYGEKLGETYTPVKPQGLGPAAGVRLEASMGAAAGSLEG
jgi:hypothetical protein